ncbi:MAG: FISUMP domain-containing protein [bacterium]
MNGMLKIMGLVMLTLVAGAYGAGAGETVSGTVTDVDSNVYHTVTIGTQTWMVESLRTTRLNDGGALALVTNSAAWAKLETPGYCWYLNEDAGSNRTFGALYNWYAVNTGKLAPAGWHVATEEEWGVLVSFLGGGEIAGGKLKAAGVSLWKDPNVDADNSTGFSALPGGLRDQEGVFTDRGLAGAMWTSTEYDITISKYFNVKYDSAELDRGGIRKKCGLGVRCIKNHSPGQNAAIRWLEGQINPGTKLVSSYAGNPTCWLYDQALAVIAFAEAGGPYTRQAREILQFLEDHRNQPSKDECYWYFAYEADGKQGGEYTTTAVNAWTVLATLYYEAKTGDKRFRPMAEAALNWIQHRCLKSIKGKEGVVMADRNYALTPYDDTTVFSTEHNLDAYSAFYHMGILTGGERYLKTAAGLKSFLRDVLWDGRRFRGGCDITGQRNEAFYLDAQSWGVLALGPEYGSGLPLAEEKCLVTNKTHTLNNKTVTGIAGFTEWTGTSHYWAEGTEGLVAAWLMTGQAGKAAFYHQQTWRLAEGVAADSRHNKLGIPYATPDAVGVSVKESVAGTAWFYFNERGVNPFRPPLKQVSQ